MRLPPDAGLAGIEPPQACFPGGRQLVQRRGLGADGQDLFRLDPADQIGEEIRLLLGAAEERQNAKAERTLNAPRKLRV
ncbi:hypothetical protein [Marinimicrococcus flavescens]|uniref:Uncharacterized protein n=1 Tax=Marinimicrococcus flavescens TaxID=3031815 RepID=A0AAP3XPL5_9PROT|nr:hypothetical protein [Marinimicrococcus flavescens]